MKRKTQMVLAGTVLALYVALAVVGCTARAQTVQSHQSYVESVSCKRFADSASFVVAQTQAGAGDAEIQADMVSFGMRPLDDHLRTVLEQNATAVTVNEVLQVTYANCMQGMGR